MAGEQVASYRVDIRYKSGKEESIQARQGLKGCRGGRREPRTERSALANFSKRSSEIDLAGFAEGRRRLITPDMSPIP